MGGGAEEKARKVYKALKTRFQSREAGTRERIKVVKTILNILDPREDLSKEEGAAKEAYNILAGQTKAKINGLKSELVELEREKKLRISLPDKVYAVSSLDRRGFPSLLKSISTSLEEKSPTGGRQQCPQDRGVASRTRAQSPGEQTS